MSNERNILRDLKALAQIEPDAEATERAIKRARSSLADQVVKQMPVSRGRLFRPRNIAAALAAAVLIVVISQSFPARNTGKFAFAQVQEQVEKTKSVQYVQTERVISKENKKLLEAVRKVMILDGHLQRTEEMQPGHWINIYDAKNGTTIALFPDKKQFSTSKEVNFLDLTDPEKSGTEEIKPDPKADFYESFRRTPAENAKQLPEQSIDGKLAVGFVVEEKLKGRGGLTTWKRTYWVDPTTKLPIRIETSWRSADPMVGNSDWVRRDIVFDAPLDPALFSIDPPEGYTDLAAVKPQKGGRTESEAASGGTRLGATLLAPFLFAEVQQEVEKVKSVQYVEKLQSRAADGRVREEHTKRVMLLGDDLKRQEWSQKVRNESRGAYPAVFHEYEWVNIQDLHREKALTLVADQKAYLIEKPPVLPPVSKLRKWNQNEDHEPPPTKPGEYGLKIIAVVPPLITDEYEQIKRVAEDKTIKLPVRTIDGKEAAGFQVEEKLKMPQGVITYTRNYWVDTTTKLPIRIEAIYRGADPKPGEAETTITDIVFDAPLDPALFSTDPPEGWTNLAKQPPEAGDRPKPE